MKSIPKIYRQGDVLLIRIPKLPATAQRQEVKESRIILAHGEATGHHHSIAKTSAIFHSDDSRKGDMNFVGIVEVAEALALLEHQEHSAITLEAGFYEVRRQREYHPQEIRQVAD
jgi:hypothetical protein